MGIMDRIKRIWKSNHPTDILEERNLFSIRPKDILSILGEEYEVIGSIHFKDGNYPWIEYKLRKTNEVFWMSVEEDDELEVSMYKEIIAITTEPPKEYVYDGITYYMQEGSDARIEKVEGNLKVTPGAEVDYYEYSDTTGEKYLSIEIWDGEVEMSIGWPIPPYQIEIFPGTVE